MQEKLENVSNANLQQRVWLKSIVLPQVPHALPIPQPSYGGRLLRRVLLSGMLALRAAAVDADDSDDELSPDARPAKLRQTV